MTSVFLSYSSRDRAMIVDIARVLHDDAVDVWLDEWQLAAGNDIDRGIEQGVADCDTFCLGVSNASLRSSWVAHELALARRRLNSARAARLALLMLERVAPIPELAGLPAVDFTYGFDAGMAALREVLAAITVKTSRFAGFEVATARRGPPTQARSLNRIGTVAFGTEEAGFTLLVESVGHLPTACGLTGMIGGLVISTLQHAPDRILNQLTGSAEWLPTWCSLADNVVKAETALLAGEERATSKACWLLARADRITLAGIGGVGGVAIRRADGWRPTPLSIGSGAQLLQAAVATDNRARAVDAPLGALAGPATPAIEELQLERGDYVAIATFPLEFDDPLPARPHRDAATIAGELARMHWPPFDDCLVCVVKRS